eukprot:3940638-Rhodomonas_salina.1
MVHPDLVREGGEKFEKALNLLEKMQVASSDVSALPKPWTLTPDPQAEISSNDIVHPHLLLHYGDRGSSGGRGPICGDRGSIDGRRC